LNVILGSSQIFAQNIISKIYGWDQQKVIQNEAKKNCITILRKSASIGALKVLKKLPFKCTYMKISDFLLESQSDFVFKGNVLAGSYILADV